MSRTRIRTLKGLEKLARLRQVALSSTLVRDLSPLAPLTRLESVDISESKVLSLAPLKRVQTLRFLYADSTGITDIAPVVQHPLLQTLSVVNALVPWVQLRTMALRMIRRGTKWEITANPFDMDALLDEI